MDMLVADRAGHDLHRTGTVVTPDPCRDLGHAAAPRRKERRMPAEEPVRGERLVVPARGIEHHLDDPLDMAIRRLECSDIDSEAAADPRTDLFRVELVSLDLAALEHVGR